MNAKIINLKERRLSGSSDGGSRRISGSQGFQESQPFLRFLRSLSGSPGYNSGHESKKKSKKLRKSSDEATLTKCHNLERIFFSLHDEKMMPLQLRKIESGSPRGVILTPERSIDALCESKKYSEIFFAFCKYVGFYR